MTSKHIPAPIEWLAEHSYANLGTDSECRSIDEICNIGTIAHTWIELFLEQRVKNSLVLTWPDGNQSAVSFYTEDENVREKAIAEYVDAGATVSPYDAALFPELPKAELLYKLLTLFHANAEEAEAKANAWVNDLGIEVKNLKLKELFHAFAFVQLKHAESHISGDGGWTPLAIEYYTEAAAAIAIGGGESAWRTEVFRGDIETARDHGRKGGAAKAQKSEPVRQHVLKLWRSRRWASRTSFATQIQSEILAVAAQHGVRLAPTNAVRQILDWLRESERLTPGP